MQQKKIPTIIGLLLVAGAVMLFRLAFDRVGPYLTRASASETPQNVTLTNISDSSFTASWTTTDPTTGAVIIEGIAAPYYDDRQSQTESSLRKLDTRNTHNITVRNVKPETTYKFRILSGTKTYLREGKPYEVRTAPIISGTGINLEPAYGQVIDPSGSPAEGAIVLLSLEGSQTVSTLVNASGSWVIPLNLVRTEDLTQYMSASERMNESIIIRSAQGEASALTDSLNDNPVPAMTIGKTYDFRKIQANTVQNPPLANAPPTVLGATAETVTATVAIIKPAQDAAISSNLPLIQGTGVPGNSVLIVVGLQNPLSTTVTVGADGVWRYTPERPLAEGKQSVTITTTDATGKTKALTNTFEVLKSGTQVLGDATPSATLTPTIALTPEPTATIAGEPMPTSGTSLPTIILLILGITLLLGGTGVLLL